MKQLSSRFTQLLFFDIFYIPHISAILHRLICSVVAFIIVIYDIVIDDMILSEIDFFESMYITIVFCNISVSVPYSPIQRL